MTKVEEIFFSILRCALWEQRPAEELPMTQEVWGEIIGMAKEQAVTGLMADGILNRHCCKVEGTEKMTLISYLLTIERQNSAVNRELTSISEWLTKQGIGFCVVKGQVIGQLYAHPEQRQAGDIDIYCGNSDIERLKGLMAERGIHLEDDFSSRHFSFEQHGVEFEIHYKLANFNTKGNRRYWDRLVEEDLRHSGNNMTEIEGKRIPTLSATMNATFVFIHLYHHFLKEGVGLRQLCDWARVLHRCKEDIDRKELEGILSRLGYIRAYRALGSILTERLGLQEADFPFVITRRDKRYGQRILKEVMRGGNFGWYGRKTTEGGVLHSLETGIVSLRHCLRYCALSPKESLMFLPIQAYHSIVKNWHYCKRYGNIFSKRPLLTKII